VGLGLGFFFLSSSENRVNFSEHSSCFFMYLQDFQVFMHCLLLILYMFSLKIIGRKIWLFLSQFIFIYLLP